LRRQCPFSKWESGKKDTVASVLNMYKSTREMYQMKPHRNKYHKEWKNVINAEKVPGNGDRQDGFSKDWSREGTNYQSTCRRVRNYGGQREPHVSFDETDGGTITGTKPYFNMTPKSLPRPLLTRCPPSRKMLRSQLLGSLRPSSDLDWYSF
jgi:hypothetical protein